MRGSKPGALAGNQCGGVADEIMRKRRLDLIANAERYTDDPVLLLEAAMGGMSGGAISQKRKLKMKKDAAVCGQCDISCHDDGMIVEVEKSTFVCRRHGRQHVCDRVRGDDHPVVIRAPEGHYTCMFSDFVIGQVKIMQDPSIGQYGDEMTSMLSDVCAEDAEAGEDGYAQETMVGGDDCEAEEGCDDQGTVLVADAWEEAELQQKRRKVVWRSKSSMEIVREKTIEVLMTLCRADTRTLIRDAHARLAEKEMRKRLQGYIKQCKRKNVRCIVQIKEQIVLQSVRKHHRYVPKLTESQMRLWTGIVALMWSYFAPHRKKPRCGLDDIKDSSAGVLPFVFGSLYAMSEGMVYDASTVLTRDPALAVVMPPAGDLVEFGYKQQYKSAGRKVVARAVNSSIPLGCVERFRKDVARLYERIGSSLSSVSKN